MNPLLPVALSIGTVRSAQRLASKGVFCLNPARISISGKIRIFCFDKTGTLTKEGLDFLGVQPAVNGSFGSMQSPEQNHTLPQQIMRALASCHAVARFGVTFVGNQVRALLACLHNMNVRVFATLSILRLSENDDPLR
jgi:cation-transporting ATPase 13A3/4/5